MLVLTSGSSSHLLELLCAGFNSTTTVKDRKITRFSMCIRALWFSANSAIGGVEAEPH